MARQDVVPGIPKQSPSPRALEAARTASRASSPEIQEAEISGIKAHVATLEKRVDSLHDGQARVITAVDSLMDRVGEWELKAATSEHVKVQEEQKTKRLMAIIGLITVILAPAGTAVVNEMRTPARPPETTRVYKSEMEIELRACDRRPTHEQWAQCWRDVSLKHAGTRQR